MAINKYPYTSFNEYNLDWIIEKIKYFEGELTDYEVLHSITFGGDWDISKSYTQWTIVSDPISHNGYLSLKPVPANVPITNTEYWLKIADYTTGLADLDDRMDAIESDITDNVKPSITAIEDDITDNVKPSITAIESDITDNVKPSITAIEDDITDNVKPSITAIEDDITDNVKPSITAIEDDITNNIKPDITAIENDIINIRAAMVKKPTKIICIGDSYGLNNAGWSGWGYELDNYLQDVPVYVTAGGGSGFIGDPANDTYLELLQGIANSVDDPDSITDIMVGGGYNDAALDYTEAQLSLAAKSFMDYVKATYKNATVHFAFLGVDYNTTTMQQKLLQYALLVFPNVCSIAGIAYVPNAYTILLNKNLLYYSVGNPNNYFHPSTDGCRMIARKLINYLFAGYFDVRYGETFSGIGCYMTNGEIDIYAVGYPFNSTLATIPFNTWTQIIDLQNVTNILWGTNDPDTAFQFYCGLTDNTGDFKGNVRVRITQKKVEILNVSQPGGMTIDGGGFYLDIPSMHIPMQAAY